MIHERADDVAVASSNVWVAIAYGATDISGSEGFPADSALLIVPTVPGPPLVLPQGSAQLWRRLIDGGIPDSQLHEDERVVVREMAQAGVVSNDVGHPFRVRDVPEPWLSAVLHEIVYSLVSSVARANEIPILFVKGPVLHRQGLRTRDHSGDVDVWVQPDRIGNLIRALEPWGWSLQPDLWGDAPVNHSLTLVPTGGWGCEIDVHRRMPGSALSDRDAFAAVKARSENVEFAGIHSSVPRTSMHAVLAALHQMRPHVGMGTSATQVSTTAEVLRNGGADSVTMAAELDAVEALREVLLEAFPDSHFGRGGKPRDWLWRAQSTKARSYLMVVKELPWSWRFRIAFRLVWPTSDVVMESERRVSDDFPGIVRARVRRLRRGVFGTKARQASPE